METDGTYLRAVAVQAATNQANVVAVVRLRSQGIQRKAGAGEARYLGTRCIGIKAWRTIYNSVGAARRNTAVAGCPGKDGATFGNAGGSGPYRGRAGRQGSYTDSEVAGGRCWRVAKHAHIIGSVRGQARKV